jgi:hypothetical protein
MRRDADGTFRIGDADVEIDHDSNVIVHGKSYKGTRGLFELLTRKKVDQTFITEKDLQSYKEILQTTHGQVSLSQSPQSLHPLPLSLHVTRTRKLIRITY